MMTGTCYIGVAGPDSEIGICRDSIEQIERRPGDAIWYGRGTKGYEVRQRHFNNFIDSDHEWLLMLDHDMVYAPDTLTRLMAHGVHYVSGYYLQRRYHPMLPVWFKPNNDGATDWVWPMEPFLDEPESGRLHELGASGWGCVLIHRTVVEAVRARILKGQWDVLEDAMDTWPYDLAVVMAALSEGDIETLRRELCPLRGQYDRQPIGSDIRYPFYARAAGYPLYGDPDVRPGHLINYPLDKNDFSQQDAGMKAAVQEQAQEATARGRAMWKERMRLLYG